MDALGSAMSVLIVTDNTIVRGTPAERQEM